MKFIIDAHSWIEYLNGSESGEKLNKILKEDNEIYVLPITIAEVIGKIKKLGKNIETAYKTIITNAQIMESTPKIAKEAGILYVETRKVKPAFGIVDALLIATAKINDIKIVTGDSHFKSFKEAIII